MQGAKDELFGACVPLSYQVSTITFCADGAHIAAGVSQKLSRPGAHHAGNLQRFAVLGIYGGHDTYDACKSKRIGTELALRELKVVEAATLSGTVEESTIRNPVFLAKKSLAVSVIR